MIDCEFDTLILSLVLIWIFYVFNFILQLSKFYYWLNACKLYCLDKDFIVQLAEDIIPSTVEKCWKDDRKAKKDAAYKELYNQLPLKGKLISQFRRFKKAIYKPFESLDY